MKEAKVDRLYWNIINETNPSINPHFQCGLNAQRLRTQPKQTLFWTQVQIIPTDEGFMEGFYFPCFITCPEFEKWLRAGVLTLVVMGGNFKNK